MAWILWPRLLRWSLKLTAFGLAGLLLGMLLFPHSNLLGGLALVFGPLYWIGLVVLAVVLLASLVSLAFRPFFRRRGDS